MTKQCKQCLVDYPDSDTFFRPYVSRSKGKRHTRVGRNTICRTCEGDNAYATSLWRKKERTAEEEEALILMANYYRNLVDQGGEPLGSYATHVLGRSYSRSPRHSNKLESLMTRLQTTDEILVEYQMLLELDLTGDPDEYQNKLDDLRERSAGPDGRVADQYREIFEQVATRIDNYEDNYEWV